LFLIRKNKHTGNEKDKKCHKINEKNKKDVSEGTAHDTDLERLR
jgi:hypothetical protein